MKNPTYSIVIPVYGSAATLEKLHSRIKAVMEGITPRYELIFIDDCGPGDPWKILQKLSHENDKVIALQLMSNAGQGAATLCGLSHSRGEFVITMDDDLQHPPEEIPVLIKALQEKPELDVVMGKPREKSHHPVRKLGSRVVHEINSILLGKRRDIYFTSFRILRRPVVDVLLSLRNMHPALGPMINSVTSNIGNVPVEHHTREEGKSGYSILRIAKQLMGNFVGYSMLPLHMVGIIGLVGILGSIAFGIILLVRYWTGGIGVPGFTTIVLLLVMLSGVSFFSFAVIGEYLLKILQLSNARPQYVVRSSSTPTISRTTNSSTEGDFSDLTDDIIYLRPLEHADLDRTLDWINRPDISRAIGVSTPVTRKSQNLWFEALKKARQKVVFAICRVSDDGHIGNVSLDNIDQRHGNGRISIFVADQGQRSQGIGSRAMRLLMREAFVNRRLNKIWCKTTAGNPAIVDFYERLGFRQEGLMREQERLDGEFVDKVVLGLLRSDWEMTQEC